MRAESVPLSHPVHLWPLFLVAVGTCVLAAALLLAAVLLDGGMGRAPETLLTAPFRWGLQSGQV